MDQALEVARRKAFVILDGTLLPIDAKRVAYYRSEIIIAAIVLWLRADLQDTP